MEITLRHTGSYRGNPSSIIDIRVETASQTLIESVTDFTGLVDPAFIQNLRDVAQDLEDQNSKILNSTGV